MAVTARLDLDPDPDVPDALIVSVVAETDGARTPLDLILGMPVLRHADWALDPVEGWSGFL